MSISKKFYPVIHCVDPFEGGAGHAMKNTRTALENGADGVFLIGHKLQYQELCEIYDQVRKQFPEVWIGLNFLDIGSGRRGEVFLSRAVGRRIGLNALWMDFVPGTRLEISDRIQVFGGVAFKYIDANLRGPELAAACYEAVKHVDVVTTSGERTGSPPDVAKLEEIRLYLSSDTRLAVASGVDEANVAALLPFADIFLVASSISEKNQNLGGHEYLVPEKVAALAAKIHAFHP